MKSFFVAILGMLVLLCSLASCEHTVKTVESVSFDTLSVDTVCSLFKNYSKPACSIHVKLAYPTETASAEFQKSFRHFVASLSKDGGFDDDAEQDFRSMAQNYVHNYILDYLGQGHDAIDSYGEDMEAAATWMSYEEKVEGSVVYNENGIICYKLDVNSYTGGAHGYDDVEMGVFSISRLNSVELIDVFPGQVQNEINNMIRQKLVQNYNCETLEELSDSGLFFDPNEVEATENFLVDASGITWIYDPYEIAPFSTGEVNVQLKWSEVNHLIPLDSPLKVIAEKNL